MALASCPAQNLQPPSNGMTWNDASLLCSFEAVFSFGIAAIVWDQRAKLDHYAYSAWNATNDPAGMVGSSDVMDYCIAYSLFCDHYNWQQGCLCTTSYRHCQPCSSPEAAACPNHQLAVSKGCTGCHAIDAPGTNGAPSFRDIGARYTRSDFDGLAERVRAGTAFRWGRGRGRCQPNRASRQPTRTASWPGS